MTEINNIPTNIQPPPVQNAGNPETDAHYSSDLKVKRPKIVPAEGPEMLSPVHVFNDRDATLKMKQINNDIYEGSKTYTPKKKKKSKLSKIESKEDSKHGFNSKQYFKIFASLALAVLAFAGIRKIRSWKRPG